MNSIVEFAEQIGLRVTLRIWKALQNVASLFLREPHLESLVDFIWTKGATFGHFKVLTVVIFQWKSFVHFMPKCFASYVHRRFCRQTILLWKLRSQIPVATGCCVHSVGSLIPTLPVLVICQSSLVCAVSVRPHTEHSTFLENFQLALEFFSVSLCGTVENWPNTRSFHYL